MKEVYERRMVQLILLFWAIYFSFVALTNVIDGLKTMNIVSENWQFSSGNFAFISEEVSIYQTPFWVVSILFFGIVVWGSLSAILLWRALFFIQHKTNERNLFQAFFVSVGYFIALTIASELFLIYALTDKYILIVTSLLVSFYICYRFLNTEKQ